MKHITISALIFVATLVTGPAARAADGEVEKLKAKLATVTAEADALWVYVQSGPDNPNINALNRALALYQKRAYGKRK
jgi:hypothetical protein